MPRSFSNLLTVESSFCSVDKVLCPDTSIKVRRRRKTVKREKTVFRTSALFLLFSPVGKMENTLGLRLTCLCSKGTTSLKVPRGTGYAISNLKKSDYKFRQVLDRCLSKTERKGKEQGGPIWSQCDSSKTPKELYPGREVESCSKRYRQPVLGRIENSVSSLP